MADNLPMKRKVGNKKETQELKKRSKKKKAYK